MAALAPAVLASSYVVSSGKGGPIGLSGLEQSEDRAGDPMLEQDVDIRLASGELDPAFLPGGSANGLSQAVAGAPRLQVGAEMVLFLWKSPKGLVHVIGMQQGAFDLQKSSSGEQFISRNAISDATVLDRTTLVPQTDTGFRMSLSELRRRMGVVKE